MKLYFLLLIISIKSTWCLTVAEVEKPEQLIKFQIPLGFGAGELMESEPSKSDVYWKGSVTGGGVASVLGVAGALAVAAPALYIAYQSSSTGQSASSIAKKYLRSIMSGADYEYDYDYGNIDLTKRAIKNSYDVLETVSKLLHTAREMFEEN